MRDKALPDVLGRHEICAEFSGEKPRKTVAKLDDALRLFGVGQLGAGGGNRRHHQILRRLGGRQTSALPLPRHLNFTVKIISHSLKRKVSTRLRRVVKRSWSIINTHRTVAENKAKGALANSRHRVLHLQTRSDADAACSNVPQHVAVYERRGMRLLYEYMQIFPPRLVHLVHLASQVT